MALHALERHIRRLQVDGQERLRRALRGRLHFVWGRVRHVGRGMLLLFSKTKTDSGRAGTDTTGFISTTRCSTARPRGARRSTTSRCAPASKARAGTPPLSAWGSKCGGWARKASIDDMASPLPDILAGYSLCWARLPTPWSRAAPRLRCFATRWTIFPCC